MKRKDLVLIVGVAMLAAIISFIVAGLVFKTSAKNTKVPTAASLPSSFPDISNDPAYSNFLNTRALDPAQPVPVGGNANTAPFNNPR